MEKEIDEAFAAALAAESAEEATKSLSKSLANAIRVYREDPETLERLADRLEAQA